MKGSKTLSKLWANDDDIKTMVTEYAKVSSEDVAQCVKKAQMYNTKHKNRINMKKRLKGVEVVD